MGESLVQVTEGVGKKLHTWQRTIGANNVEDEATYPAEFPYPSYISIASAVSTATANSHLLQLMAAASVNLRIRRIRIEQSAAMATAATAANIQVVRLTTAGTGGTAVTPAPHDTADTASGTAQTLPTVKGTEAAVLCASCLLFRQAIAATGSQVDDAYEWTQLPGQKPLIVPAGSTNGIAIKLATAVANAGAFVTIEHVETAFTG